ncbi:MAG: hypothetical protein IPK16_04430 [Anaerolineales bacterium]|nr:hypothetical protein [Anaerolineales bacterium]
MAQTAMFGGLVFDESGRPAEVDFVGSDACYVVYDEDFRRFVDAAQVDRQVLRFMREQVQDNRQIAVSTMLEMMGKDDLFTKAAVESTIDHMEDAVGQTIPEDARQWLGMLGFRVVIDFHGEVIDIQMPAAGTDEE